MYDFVAFGYILQNNETIEFTLQNRVCILHLPRHTDIFSYPGPGPRFCALSNLKTNRLNRRFFIGICYKYERSWRRTHPRLHLAPAFPPLGASGCPLSLPRSLMPRARSIFPKMAWLGRPLPDSYSVTICGTKTI